MDANKDPRYEFGKISLRVSGRWFRKMSSQGLYIDRDAQMLPPWNRVTLPSPPRPAGVRADTTPPPARTFLVALARRGSTHIRYAGHQVTARATGRAARALTLAVTTRAW